MKRWIALTALSLAAVWAGRADSALALTLESPTFEKDGSFPRKNTCQGSDLAPALSWSGVPDGTKSLVLLVHDPDMPDPAAPRRTWIHWVLYDLPPTSTGTPQGVQGVNLPPGTREGKNDWNRTGYGGPCPPTGRHRYFFKLYALDATLGDLGKPNKAKVEEAMKGHVIAETELIGTYQKE